nr:nodulation protein H [Ipomoea batatas]
MAGFGAVVNNTKQEMPLIKDSPSLTNYKISILARKSFKPFPPIFIRATQHSNTGTTNAHAIIPSHFSSNMPEIFAFFKDIFQTKAPKKSPLVLRTVVLLFAVVCGVYIFSICMRQTANFGSTDSLRYLVDPLCSTPRNVEKWEIPLLHFPKPQTFSREECVCNPVRFFAILSMQRSGSGWFETLLNSHINVSSNGEIFNVRARRSNASMIIKTLDTVYNLDVLTSSSKNECLAAVGFKWMLNQGIMVHHEEIVDYFKRRGVSTIFLLRRNPLRRLISLLANTYDKDAKLLNGTHKSHVHSAHEAQVLAKYKPTVNMSLLIPNLRSTLRTSATALDYFKNTRHIVFYYEDIVSNRTKLTDVQEFLGLPIRNLTSLQVRIHNGALSNQVENWDEVQEKLKGTVYEQFLHTD